MPVPTEAPFLSRGDDWADSLVDRIAYPADGNRSGANRTSLGRTHQTHQTHRLTFGISIILPRLDGFANLLRRGT